MAKLTELSASFDVISAEGNAYIIGVERSLKDWRSVLEPGRVLVFSDLVWRTEAPPDDLRSYGASEHPAMTRVPVRLAQARRAGFRVLGHFDMGREAMDNYFRPLEARVAEMAHVLDDLRAELAAYHACDGIMSYEMLVLQEQ